MKVPHAIIEQVCYPTCHRPVKKVLWKPPAPAWERPNPLPAHYVRMSSVVGNLPSEDEYRYYAGVADPKGEKAYCRWCMHAVAINMLKTHRAQGSCGHMVDVTCAIMRQDNLCVGCQRFTKAGRWGVPLCPSVACERQFRLGVSSPIWMDAKTAAKALKPGSKVGHVTV